MARKKVEQPHLNHERWMVSFADFMTLMFALFVMLYAISVSEQVDIEEVIASIQESFGAVPNAGSGLMESDPGQPGPVNLIPIVMERNPAMAPLIKQLKDKLADDAGLKENVSLNYEERGIVIRLQDTLLFDSGSDQLRAQAIPSLKKVAQELQEFIKEKQSPIRIEGHTDNIKINTARFPSNWELSASRAASVLRFLRRYSNIPPGKISLAGYGEYKPIATNQTPKGRSKNRRVDIVVLNPSEQHNEPPDKNISESLNTELNTKLETGR